MEPISDNKPKVRRTENPKDFTIKFRIDAQTRKVLQQCSEALGMSQSEILRQGVYRMFDGLKK